MVFVPGISTLYDVPQDEEENKKDYEESQQQRALERKLRYEKRDLEVMKARGVPEEELKIQRERVKKASRDIDDFCEETGRTRRRDREATPINAKFPPKESYNPAEFPTTERDKMQEFFTGKKPQKTADIIHETAKSQDDNPLEELFGDLWAGKNDPYANTDYDPFALLTQEQSGPVLETSSKYGDFGIANKSYPKELRYTEKEEQYVADMLNDLRGKRVSKGYEYSRDVHNALAPVRELKANEYKQTVLDMRIQQINEQLEKAEEMIKQRKAEGYTGRSKQESYATWKSLKRELAGADETDIGEILESARVGESGIQYWYKERKSAKHDMGLLDFAGKIINREKYALEHGYNGMDFD